MLGTHGKMLLAGAAALLCAGSPALAQTAPAPANDDYLPCSDATATVMEATPEFGYNDFGGIGQRVYGLGYSRASCFKSGDPTRWHLELNAAYVDQQTFKAEALLAGIGLSLHPLRRRPDFTLYPVVRVGEEFVRRGPDNFVFGGGLTVEDAINLDPKRAVPSTAPLLVLTGQVDYVDRRSSDRLVNLANRRPGHTEVFGSAAIDAPIGTSPWRMRASAGYRLLDSDYLKGYASFSLSARPQREGELTYRWNFAITANAGDHRYRGVILSITRRFLQARRSGAMRP